MKESKLFKAMRKHLHGIDSTMILQRIESGQTGYGIPDVFYHAKEHSGWIELKEATISKKQVVTMRFQPNQIKWLDTLHKKGGNAFVVGTDKEYGYFFVIRSSCVKERYGSIEHFINLCTYISRNSIDWEKVYKILDQKLLKF
jgi:hypothetical protein